MSLTIINQSELWECKAQNRAHTAVLLFSSNTRLQSDKHGWESEGKKWERRRERGEEKKESALLRSFQSRLNSRETLAAGKWGAAFFYKYTSICASISAFSYAHVHTHSLPLSPSHTRPLFLHTCTLFSLSPQRLAELNGSSLLSHYITLQDRAPAHPFTTKLLWTLETCQKDIRVL